MPQYMIESPHTKEECLPMLDDMVAKHPDLLNKMEFGCAAGEHVGWAAVDASNAEEARKMVPEPVREKAHIVEVRKMTPEQIKEYHK